MKFLLFFAAVTIAVSCKKNEMGLPSEKNKVHHSKISLEKLLAFNQGRSYGNFTIQEFTTIAGGSQLPIAISISGGFWDKKQNKPKAVNSDVFIQGNKLITSPDFMSYQYNLSPVTPTNNLFGRRLKFDVRGGSNIVGRTTSIEDSVYIPEQIRLDFPDFIPFGTGTEGQIVSATDLYVGRTLKWNADNLNTSGVFLFIEYFPNDSGNEALKANGFTESVHNYVLVDDIGAYELTSELFEDIPNNARVRFSIARGGYTITTNPNDELEDYRVYGFSIQQDNFRFVNH